MAKFTEDDKPSVISRIPSLERFLIFIVALVCMSLVSTLAFMIFALCWRLCVVFAGLM